MTGRDLIVKSYVGSTYITYAWYVDQFGKSFIFPETGTNAYAANSVLKLTVQYWFGNNAKKEFTVWSYSSQTLEVKDADGKKNMLHMDGKKPSGFKPTQNFWGMDKTSDPDGAVNPKPVTPANPDPKPKPADPVTPTPDDKAKVVEPEDKPIDTETVPADAGAMMNVIGDLLANGDVGEVMAYVFKNFFVLFSF